MKVVNRKLFITPNTSYEEVYDRVINNKEFYRDYNTLKFIGNVDFKVRSLLINKIHCKKIELEKCDLEPLIFSNMHYLKNFWVLKNCNLKVLKIDNIPYVEALKLYKCNVDKLTITNSKLRECNFSQLTYNNITIQSSNFSKCYFKQVNLSQLDFEVNNVEFEDCSFISANLSNTKWKVNNNSTKVSHKFSKANLSNVNFNGINLSGSTFKLAKLDNTNFSNCDLYQCNFDEVILKNCDLSGANCYRTSFKNSTFKRCNLRRASIDWAILKNTNLIDTYLTTAYYTLRKQSIEHFGCSAIDLVKLYEPND